MEQSQFEIYDTDVEARWAKLAAGRLEVHHIPSDNFGMLKEPHVQVIAAKLKAYLEQAQADDGATAEKQERIA